MMQFKDENLLKAVEAIIALSGKDSTVIKASAEKLWFYIEALIRRRKVAHLYEVKGINDLLFASAHLYHLFYEENRPSTLFLLREEARVIFNAHHIDGDTQLKIFQMCECHMGEDALIDFLIPQKGYPDDLFADAIFIMALQHD